MRTDPPETRNDATAHLTEWQRVVIDVEQGYSLTIHDYTNALCGRDELQALVQQADPQRVASSIPTLPLWDMRFQAATWEIRIPLLGTHSRPRNFWWFRIPKKLSEPPDDLEHWAPNYIGLPPPLSIAQLVQHWQSFVAQVEAGFDSTFGAYQLNLSIRTLLEHGRAGRVEAHDPLDQQIRTLDVRFRAATRHVQASLRSQLEVAEAPGFWYARVPKQFSPDLMDSDRITWARNFPREDEMQQGRIIP